MKKLYTIISMVVISGYLLEMSQAKEKTLPQRPYFLKKTNSQIFLRSSTTVVEQTQTMKDEIAKFLEANNIKDKEEILKDVQQSEDNAVIRLLNVGSKLGFKRATLKNGKTLELLDISWPTIKEYAQKIIAAGGLPKTGNANNEDKELNLKDLETIMALIGEVKPAIDENGEEDRTKSSLTDEQIQQMIQLCVGKHRLFYCTEEIEKRFKQLLHHTLKNYTGFQRVASMLVIGILNSDEQQAFNFGCTSWRIVKEKEEDDACCSVTFYSINIALKCTNENASTFIHEAGHAYNTMLFGRVDGGDNENNMSIVVHSILNSPNANFVDIFFPGLTQSVFDASVKTIDAVLDKNKLDVDSIRSDIKQHIDFGYDFRTRAGRIIYNTFKNLVLAGFGRVLFDLNDSFQLSDYRFDSQKILTRSNIAKAIYILSSYMRKAKKGDYYEDSGSDDDFFKFDDDESAETIWDGTDEMLAMTGIVPYVIDGKTFVINNKQNEFIAGKRNLQADKEYNSEADMKIFRFHGSYEFSRRLSTMISYITGEGSSSAILSYDTIAFPKEMIHTATEIIDNEMKIETSAEAINTLEKKNATITDPKLYSHFAIYSNAFNKRDENFRKQIVSVPDTQTELDSKLYTAVMQRNINAIIQLLDKGASYFIQDADSFDGTRLKYAFAKHKLDIPTNSTLLHIATANQDTEVLKCLLDYIQTKKININDIVDSSGFTLLHISAMAGNNETSKLLFEYGALDKKGKNGKTAKDLADAIMNYELLLGYSTPYNKLLYSYLSPIYDLIANTKNKATLNKCLEDMKIQLPKEKIAALQQKIQSNETITDTDLDSILIAVDSQIPVVQKLQNEWNGIGHIYYLWHFKAKNTPIGNECFLLDRLAKSDVGENRLWDDITPKTFENYPAVYAKILEKYLYIMPEEIRLHWLENLTPEVYQLIKPGYAQSLIYAVVSKLYLNIIDIFNVSFGIGEKPSVDKLKKQLSLSLRGLPLLANRNVDEIADTCSTLKKLCGQYDITFSESYEKDPNQFCAILNKIKNTLKNKTAYNILLRLLPIVCKNQEYQYNIPQKVMNAIKDPLNAASAEATEKQDCITTKELKNTPQRVDHQ